MRPIVSQSSGEWDFDLIVDSSISAVEVTQSTGERTEGLYAAIFGKDGTKSSFPRVLASTGWIVTVSNYSDIRQVRRSADALIAQLEAEGRTEFSVSDNDDMASSTVRTMWEELRITDAYRPAGIDFAEHEIAPPHYGAMLSSDQVVAAVERETRKDDNRRKLAVASTQERHLFVHLSDLSYPAHEAMRSCGLPDVPVTLPSEITHVWVAAHFGMGDAHLLWRFDATNGWHNFGYIDLADA